MTCPNCETVHDMKDLYANGGRCPDCDCAMICDAHYNPEEDLWP